MKALNGLPIKLFTPPLEWARWLRVHHLEPEGIWLKIAKKGHGTVSVSYAEALDEALCFCWIDGQKQSYDEYYFLQKFTPRRPKSVWSKINVEKVAALTVAGRMKPTGVLEVEKAKQDGPWDQAYDSNRTNTVPPDFQSALDQHPNAKEFFATLNKTNVYAILWRIQTARKSETRQAKIEKFIAMLEDKQVIHP
jgi:uncharacterized protein YdeI (YjbR/CyaY-like superfamily)